MEYTVSKLNTFIKNMFASEYALNNIAVKGEIAECKYHSSGHIYFTLKDNLSQIACVMFYQSRAGLAFRMEKGDKVVVKGSVSVYERDGKYQIYAKEIVKDGIGELYLKFEALKNKLAMEGLFDEAHKKAIPAYVSKVGIVTASTGAAISDIVTTANRRNPYVQLILYPSKVQGEDACFSIAQGIKRLDEMKLDVIIVGRGGGAYEDLWAFNEEVTARAIYECKTPIISAVGHEIDFTIADYVADHRAPTPTAAAVAAVFDINEFFNYTANLADRMESIVERKIAVAKNTLAGYRLSLSNLSPQRRLERYRQNAENKKTVMDALIRNKLVEKTHRMQLMAARLEGLSPLTKLKGGYAYVKDKDGRAVESIDILSIKDDIEVTFKDGFIRAKVEDKNEQRKF